MSPDYKELTERELRSSSTAPVSPDEYATLQSSPDLWYSALLDILSRVNLSLQRRRSLIIESGWLAETTPTDEMIHKHREAKVEYELWRARTLGFKRIVEARMREVRQLVKDQNVNGRVTGAERQRDAALGALADVLVDYAQTSDMKVAELVEDLMEDHPDHSEVLRIAKERVG